VAALWAGDGSGFHDDLDVTFHFFDYIIPADF